MGGAVLEFISFWGNVVPLEPSNVLLAVRCWSSIFRCISLQLGCSLPPNIGLVRGYVSFAVGCAGQRKPYQGLLIGGDLLSQQIVVGSPTR